MSKTEVPDGAATPEELHEREVDGLERELAGALARVEELKAMPAAHADVISAAEERAENARNQLKALGKGQKAAEKRPRGSGKKETR